jgi:hypothetical protein
MFTASCLTSLKPYNLRKRSVSHIFFITIPYHFCMDIFHSSKYLSTYEPVILEMYAETHVGLHILYTLLLADF